MLAPSAAAMAMSSTCLSTASSFDMLASHWITAARTALKVDLQSWRMAPNSDAFRWEPSYHSSQVLPIS
jgi:hypothetical protein